MADDCMYSDVISEFVKNVSVYLGAEYCMHCHGLHKSDEDASIVGDFSFAVVFGGVTSHTPHVDPYYSFSEASKKGKEWHITIPGRLFCPPAWKEDYTEFTKFLMKMKEESANWSLKIDHCEHQKNQLTIFLHKESTFKTVITNVLHREHLYGCNAQKKNMGYVIQTVESQPGDRDLSQLRVEYLKNFAIKIASLAGYDVLNEKRSNDDLAIYLTTKFPEEKCDIKIVHCGAVVNAKSKTKEIKVLSDEYIRLRINDMQAAAIHKYGENVIESEKQRTLAIILGEASVRMELLQAKTSQTVSLNLDSGYIAARENSCKGAVFILYNYSRISSILKLFKTREEKKVYPPLLPPTEIDFSVLQHNDEWTLLRYLVIYPTCMTKLAKDIDDGILKPKVLCNYLNEISKAFSTYYRHTRILREPKPQLIPVMFARIYLLKALQIVMESALNVLGIDTVTQM